MIIAGSASQKLAANVANELEDYLCPVETRKFPDGEKYLRVNGNIEKNVIIIQSTGYPQDENIVELLFLIKTIKSLGAEKIKVVIPYFGYGRQEKRFKKGETISAEIVANLIEYAGANEVISINLHEDNVRDFFTIPTKNISAISPIAEYISRITENPIIIAPDKGASVFAKKIAKILDCNYTYMDKLRIAPDKVKTKIADIEHDYSKSSKVNIDSVKGKEAVIVDDIISTGGTIINTANILKKHGVKSINVCCVHPVLVNDAVLKIYTTGVKEIAGTNTLNSEVSCISVAKIIADALKIK